MLSKSTDFCALPEHYFRGHQEKGFPTDSRHSDGHKLFPSPSRHISVLIRSGIHTVFALNWKEKISISVQLHIQIHRWRIVNQLPRFWELSGSDVSRWAWGQRHDGEQHFCFLLGFTPVDREWRSAANFPLRQTWRFQLPYHKLSVPE